MNTQIEIESPAVDSSPERQLKSRRWLPFVLVLVLVLGALLTAGVLPRLSHMKALAHAAAAIIPKVSVAIAAPAATTVELALPSSVEAAQETPLYPRVNGYVKTIFADIGAQVKAGDVLAEIETPELDEQVNQARATLEQATANLTLAQKSFTRWEELQRTRVVSPQDVDERKGTLDARRADLHAAQASLQRLQRMQGYQKITAPFSGTVTKRMVEVGQLVTGDLNDSTRVLFQLAQTASLRAFVNVPQSSYRYVAVGQIVQLTFRERAGRTFPGTVVRTAGALENATRTLRTEVRIPNESGELVPGLYADVKFQVQREHPPIAVPSRALILQSSGPQIATLDDADRAHLRSVTIGRDFGQTLEIDSGLEAGARFVTNPADTLREGAAVQINAQ